MYSVYTTSPTSLIAGSSSCVALGQVRVPRGQSDDLLQLLRLQAVVGEGETAVQTGVEGAQETISTAQKRCESTRTFCVYVYLCSFDVITFQAKIDVHVSSSVCNFTS